METKPLLYGLIGFFVGGLLVATAANTFDKAELQDAKKADTAMQMSMSDMTSSLAGKTGEDFDKTFLREMIVHHQGAVDMAELARKYAKHQEVKDMAGDIVNTQLGEINQMRSWQTQWGYAKSAESHHRM